MQSPTRLRLSLSESLDYPHLIASGYNQIKCDAPRLPGRVDIHFSPSTEAATTTNDSKRDTSMDFSRHSIAIMSRRLHTFFGSAGSMLMGRHDGADHPAE